MRKNTIVVHQPTGSELWDKYFTVKMLYLHSRDVDRVRRFGMRVSGVEAVDRHLDKQEIVTQMSIDRMFEKHRSGVTIRVMNYNDTAEIYRIIHHHLIAWAEYLATGVNTGSAPLKDLIELDAFASVVYDKAVSVFSQEVKATALASNFANVQAINFTNILKRAREESETIMTANGVEVTRITKETPDLPERSSLKEIFTNQMNAIGGWRNNG